MLQNTLDSISLAKKAEVKSGDHAGKVAQEFRSRLEKYLREEMPKMTAKDAENMKDPQNISEFTQEIYQAMLL